VLFRSKKLTNEKEWMEVKNKSKKSKIHEARSIW